MGVWKRRVWNTAGGHWLLESFSISSCRFLWRVALLFKTKMDNPFSNSTWSKMKCISNKKYQTCCVSVFYSSLNTTLSIKTATNSSGAKVGHLSTKTQHSWYHLTDRRYYFFHVKFGIRFVIFFTRKSMLIKKRHFSWGMAILSFQKRGLKNWPLFIFLRMPETHDVCVDRAKKRKIRPFIHLARSKNSYCEPNSSQVWLTAAEPRLFRSIWPYELRRKSWRRFQASFIDWVRLCLSYMGVAAKIHKIWKV
jgi:hypothetical protein